jgi:predicted glycosyltransferase
MRVLIDIGHPAHVHFHKHIIWGLQQRGHEVLISARDKDVALTLLDHYGFSYHVLSTLTGGRFGLYKEFFRRDWALLRLIRELDPDVVTAIGGAFISPVCKVLGKPSIVFTDTEDVSIDRYLTYPLASIICTPQCFKRDLNNGRQVRYAGFHELAYLHPGYFQPDPKIVVESQSRLGTYRVIPLVETHNYRNPEPLRAGIHNFGRALDWRICPVSNLCSAGSDSRYAGLCQPVFGRRRNYGFRGRHVRHTLHLRVAVS